MFTERSFSWQVFKKLQRQTPWVWARAGDSEILFELFASLLLHQGYVQDGVTHDPLYLIFIFSYAVRRSMLTLALNK